MPDEGTAASKARKGRAAVIVAAWRTRADEAGYAAAAQAMDAFAAQQPGCLAAEAAREANGFGITVSHRVDKERAAAWRTHPEHAAGLGAGRRRWYDAYDLHLAHVSRSHGWRRT